MNKINGNFYHQNIISVSQFSKKDIEILFDLAAFYQKGIEKGSIYHELSGKILTALFYEPSSRTFGSFIAAMQRLGGGIIPIQGVAYSSVVKGENLTDTIKTFQSYSDVIAFRHPQKGAAALAAKVSQIPIINAGDGVGEHPTQALLDLFTISNCLRRTDNLKVALVGDLKYGRTVHSLSQLLSLFSQISLYFISPPLSPMPSSILSFLKRKGLKIHYAETINQVIKDIDVLYLTRIQKERMKPEIYEKLKGAYQLDNKLANKMKKEAIIMHPLPRVGEIAQDVDDNPRAVYFKHQTRNGLFIRMALLRLILKK